MLKIGAAWLAAQPVAEARHRLRREHRAVVLAKEHVRTAPLDQVTARRVAEQAGLSRQQFCRVFRANVGMTLTEYILRARIDRAKTLLRGTDTTIKQVAFAAGFRSAAYFARAFRRITGVTPAEFRAGRRG